MRFKELAIIVCLVALTLAGIHRGNEVSPKPPTMSTSVAPLPPELQVTVDKRPESLDELVVRVRLISQAPLVVGFSDGHPISSLSLQVEDLEWTFHSSPPPEPPPEAPGNRSLLGLRVPVVTSEEEVRELSWELPVAELHCHSRDSLERLFDCGLLVRVDVLTRSPDGTFGNGAERLSSTTMLTSLVSMITESHLVKQEQARMLQASAPKSQGFRIKRLSAKVMTGDGEAAVAGYTREPAGGFVEGAIGIDPSESPSFTPTHSSPIKTR